METGRDWSEVATSPGWPEAASSWARQEGCALTGRARRALLQPDFDFQPQNGGGIDISTSSHLVSGHLL